jgi:hypothetical protein
MQYELTLYEFCTCMLKFRMIWFLMLTTDNYQGGLFAYTFYYIVSVSFSSSFIYNVQKFPHEEIQNSFT